MFAGDDMAEGLLGRILRVDEEVPAAKRDDT
jgi:hypothetical protein